ncbi:hypothetical protein DNU06_01385 [Putridiphycobacter roseus]|uniref:HMA domain-containing protein n=1 Tax=Putridiphycobacter roseus TaxID=2219161 RepID=A0A2W1NHD7_9FLAO|nr:heavy metal-associated domain-containing protein [Putridiphycobacter roseus]PZE18513.1 hypothetical protein DNU06_01385 [Putridiphycobacter roseus]
MKILLTATLLSTLFLSCNEANTKTTTPKIQTENTLPKTVSANSKTSFEVSGMMCEIGCVRTIKSHLSKMEGVTNIYMDFDTARAVDYSIVEFDSNFVNNKDMKAEIEDIANGIYEVTTIEKLALK